MNNILIYTFRTFPWIEELRKISSNTIVLSQPKQDLEKVKVELLKNKYDLVLGVARAKRYSRFETAAVNIFHKRQLRQEGAEMYIMDYPKEKYEKIYPSDRHFTTFCNWAMYNIAECIDKNGIETKHTFVHILKKDIPSLNKFSNSSKTIL